MSDQGCPVGSQEGRSMERRPLFFTMDRRFLRSHNTYARFRRMFAVPVVHAESTNQKESSPANQPAALLQPSQSEVVIVPPKMLPDEEIQAYIDSEDGKTRLKNLFTLNQVGGVSRDIQLVAFGTCQAAVITFMLGCWIGAKQAGEYYVRRHQAAKYTTRYKAMRSYYDAVIVGSMAHGFRYAVKIGSFTAIFMMTSQCIATYRNKTSPFEYTAGGFVTGAVLRMTLGLRGMLAGGLFGGMLGFAGGVLLWGVMAYSNDRQQDRYFRHVQEILLESKRLKTIQETSARRSAERTAKSEAVTT